MPHASINGLRLWYDAHGAGRRVLLIMGLAGRGAAWAPQVEGLYLDHHVVHFDNRGIGRSDRFAGSTTTVQMAQDALGLMDHLGWGDAHVVGVSMGGMIAQELALRHRDRVRSLALIATHAGGLGALMTPWPGMRLFLQANHPDPGARIDALRRLLYTRQYLRQMDAQAVGLRLMEDFGRQPEPATLGAQLAAVMRHDTRDRLHQLGGLPTVVIRPEQDILIDPRHCLRLHRLIPGARLVNVPDAGHGVTDERRGLVNHTLREHFAQAEGAAAG
ncbi:MAG: alpha/beta fold hydrolase [Alphaproteobacteria bacterium]|nr:alpha/beta fold hydrolase [Alphaproteobacteria bacterium]